MKKILLFLLSAIVCIGLLAGCRTQTENQNAVINPLPETLDINNLDNCTVSVSLEKGDAYVDDNGKMVMRLKVYSYELYDMADVASLEVNDSVMRGGKEVKIKKLERLESGLIRINGGEENGGFDLASDNSTVYYESGMNDLKAYYELGEVILPVSTEFEFIDESDLDAEAKHYYPGDFLADDAGIIYNFKPGNTKVVIADGVILKMTKNYTP